MGAAVALAMPIPREAALAAPETRTAWFSGFLLGLSMCIVLVASTRRTLQYAARSTSMEKTVLLVLLNVGGACLLIMLPLALALLALSSIYEFYNSFWYYPVWIGSFSVVYASASAVLLAAGILLFSALMFVHRLFWPVLNRGLYAALRPGLVRRRSVVLTSGVFLIGVGFQDLARILKTILGM
jgi:hypothetical protein